MVEFSQNGCQFNEIAKVMKSGTNDKHKFTFAGLTALATQLTAASVKLKALEVDMALFQTALTDYSTKISTYEGSLGLTRQHPPALLPPVVQLRRKDSEASLCPSRLYNFQRTGRIPPCTSPLITELGTCRERDHRDRLAVGVREGLV